MSVVKDITKVSIANIIGLISAIITGFIVPAYLNIEQYAYLKTFALFLSFAGIFHLGYIDGIYIKYGGKYSHEIDMRLFKTEKYFFILFQILIAITALIIGIILKELIIIAIAVSILPFNLLSYYQFYYQAIGYFNIYSRIRLIVPFVIMLMNVILIYIINISNYLYYISAEIFAYTIAVLYLEYKYSFRIKKLNIRHNIKPILDHFKVGIYIMLGNLSMILFFTLGRWVVKLFMTDADFAYYSFATSMMQILTIVISSIAMTFYPYLSRIHQKSNLKRLKIQLIIIGAIFSSSYFIFNFAVTAFIPKYVLSLRIIGILFASFPAYAVINALYINMYKVQKDGKKYISVIIINLIAACLLTLAAFLLRRSTISIAIATTISFYFWLYYSSKDFMGLKPTLKEFVFILLYLVMYFVSVLFLNPLWALILFVSFITILSFLYKNETGELVSKLFSIIKTK